MQVKKQFLTLNEAADYLGVSKSTIYQYTHQKIIPYYKPAGRLIYFKIDDLNNFLGSIKIKSQEQIKDEAERSLLGLD
jgi:excisionase family DNA binding protein